MRQKRLVAVHVDEKVWGWVCPEAVVALPSDVRDLAMRLGATGSNSLSSVTLTQRGTMRDQPATRERRFRAVQTISLRHPEFEWRASTGPFGCISVLDAMRDGEADLEVRAFGLLRIAGVRGGAVAAKGEIMRYLANSPGHPTRSSAIPCLPGRLLMAKPCG